MVGAARFELTTSCSQSRRSTRLSYAPSRDGQTRALIRPNQEIPRKSNHQSRRLDITAFENKISSRQGCPTNDGPRCSDAQNRPSEPDAGHAVVGSRAKHSSFPRPCQSARLFYSITSPTHHEKHRRNNRKSRRFPHSPASFDPCLRGGPTASFASSANARNFAFAHQIIQRS